MSNLFSPFTIRNIILRNRIVMSPMCHYSASDGYSNNWHLTHYGSRAVAEIQLAHAGRKASCDLPWTGGKQLNLNNGGWYAVAPSEILFTPGERIPGAILGSSQKNRN